MAIAAEEQWDRYEAELRGLWRREQARLRRLLGSLGATTFERARARTLLSQIDAVLADLKTGTEDWLNRTLPRTFRHGFNWTGTGLRQTDWAVSQAVFGQVQQESINAIALAIALDARAAVDSIAQTVGEIFTQSSQAIIDERQLLELVGREVMEGRGPRVLGRDIAQTLRTGATKKLKAFTTETGLLRSTVSPELLDSLKLAADGKYIRIFCKDGVWRRYNMRWYSDVVARTATRQAQTEGMLQSCQQLGIDLVAWTVHSGACPICIPLQGKVYSLSGADPRFPPLTAANRPPVHPNCAHSLSPAPAEQLQQRGMLEPLSTFSLGEGVVENATQYAELFDAAEAVAA